MQQAGNQLSGEDIESADGTLADEDAQQEFGEIDFKGTAGIADDVGRSEREKAPADDDGEFIFSQ